MKTMARVVEVRVEVKAMEVEKMKIWSGFGTGVVMARSYGAGYWAVLGVWRVQRSRSMHRASRVVS